MARAKGKSMRIYLAQRNGFANPMQIKNMIIVANSEDEARDYASEHVAVTFIKDENVWLSLAHSDFTDIGIAHDKMNLGVLLANGGTLQDALAIVGA